MPDQKRPEESGEPDPLMDALSRIIVEKLISSEEVRCAVRELLEEHPHLNGQSHMVMMLKLSALAEALGVNPEFMIDGELLEPGVPHADMSDKVGKVVLRNVVDGEELSESEKAFHEYLADSFDEAAWLRKNNLTL